jgi:hypothetical protein
MALSLAAARILAVDPHIPGKIIISGPEPELCCSRNRAKQPVAH